MSAHLKSAIASLDLFSRNFILRTDKGSELKKTIFGGILTIAIFGIAFAYLIFLLYVFFKHQTPPTITTTHIVNYAKTSIDFDFPPIAFQMHMPQGCKKIKSSSNFFNKNNLPLIYFFKTDKIIYCKLI
jgi:hypothetical protein